MRSIKDKTSAKYSPEYPQLPRPFKSVTIQQAVWLFPVCIAGHFLEEATGFASWAGRNISFRYTAWHWRRVHGVGMLLAIAASAAGARWMNPLTIFLFTAVFLTPMVFNALFHAAASVYFCSYSPGTVTALMLFPALCWYLASRFSQAGFLDARFALTATVIGATLHGLDLAATTFFLQRTPRS